MKHLLLFERYSQPFAVGKLTAEVSEFIEGEFENWVMRKGLANYSHFYEYIPKFKNDDFPVSKIKLKLIFVVVKKYKFVNTSGASYYKVKYNRMDKEEKILTPKIKKNGDTEIGIEIKIYAPKYKESFEKIFDEIESLVMHEIQHSYRTYKLQNKKIKRSKDESDICTLIVNISEEIRSIIGKYEGENEIIYDFFDCVYMCSNESEIGSYLSQLYAKDGDVWVEGFLKIRNTSFEQIWKLLLPYENIIKKYSIKDHIDLKFYKGVKGFMKFLYDIVDKKKDYIFKKMMKIRANIE